MITKNNPLDGRVGIALVTGGSRGLGKNMSIALAKKGIDVILTYNRNLKAANEVVSEIQSLGQKAAAFQLDTSKVKSFDNFIGEMTEYLQQQTGSPNFDFLINNAGIGLYAPFENVTEEQWDEIVNIHYKGVFFLTQKALPYINESGAIIKHFIRTYSDYLPRFFSLWLSERRSRNFDALFGKRIGSKKNSGERSGSRRYRNRFWRWSHP